MKKFEYQIMPVPKSYDEETILPLLNQQGQEGWEAVHWFVSKMVEMKGNWPVEKETNKIIFKREI
jgi:hypothetical protein